MQHTPLPITRLHSIEVAVHEANSWLGYLTRALGFQSAAVSTPAAIERSGTRRHLLACGEARIVLAEPVHGGSSVRRFLEKHPEGVYQVNFEVADVRSVEGLLLERHATCTDFIRTETMTGGGEWSQLNITTPLGDVEYAFVQSSDAQRLMMPGMQSCGTYDESANPAGITGFDHFTSNVRSLMPVLAFYEHVMGFARCWDVRFHTEDLRPGVGAGLTSVVMGHESSGIRIANNEPLRPRFSDSQVQLYVDTNRGPGIQQVALGVRHLVRATEHARQAGASFLPIPPTYYEMLPGRLSSKGVTALGESMETLSANGILVDGDRHGLLYQAFLRDQATEFGRPSAGPLVLELIQRNTVRGFGEGNFRALFEATQKLLERACG